MAIWTTIWMRGDEPNFNRTDDAAPAPVGAQAGGRGPWRTGRWAGWTTSSRWKAPPRRPVVRVGRADRVRAAVLRAVAGDR